MSNNLTCKSNHSLMKPKQLLLRHRKGRHDCSYVNLTFSGILKYFNSEDVNSVPFKSLLLVWAAFQMCFPFLMISLATEFSIVFYLYLNISLSLAKINNFMDLFKRTAFHFVFSSVCFQFHLFISSSTALLYFFHFLNLTCL